MVVGTLPQRMGSNQQLFLYRTDRCSPGSSRFPQCHQSRCSLLRQSVIYDSSHRTLLQKTNQPVPQSYGEITRCIFDSLALRYKQVFGYLQQMAPFPIEKLHIIGGGSRNNLLNQFTCNAVGVPVIAGPSEGTAIGNIMLQAKANGLVNDIAAMRQLISTSIETVSFEPQQAEEWEEAYKKYLAHYREDI